MKLSVSTMAWDESENDFVFSILKERGVVALEILPTKIVRSKPYDHIDVFYEYKRKLKEYGLGISSIQSILYGRNENIFGDIEQRSSLIVYLNKMLEFSARLGINNTVFGCPKNRVMGTQGKEDMAISFFEELSEYAEKYQVHVSIEPIHFSYGTDFLNTTNETFEFLQKIDSPWINLNCDTGTIFGNLEDVEIIDKCISKVNHVHFSEMGLVPLERRIEYNKLVKILRSHNYNNYISLEMKRPESIEVLKKTINYFTDLFM